jgi:hypothetical protein
MEKPNDFYTTSTENNVPIFAADHSASAEAEDRCVSLSVGQSSTTFKSEVARSLAAMLLGAADALDAGSLSPS